MQEKTEAIKREALRLGFQLCGISGKLSAKNSEFYEWWVNQGFGADMHFLKTQKKRRRDISEVLPGAKSVIVCALRFPGGPERLAKADEGKLARYAAGEDYHNRLLPLLSSLAKFTDQKCNSEGSLAYVDTGPIGERAFAAQAGIGWIGKNAMLIHPEEGSWFWIGEVITRAALTPDSPMADRCGKCRACIDACPTQAIFEGIRAIDSRRCLSYLNIENRGTIPKEFETKMGSWVLGCDICQEVCPWNQQTLRTGRKEIGAPPVELVSLEEIMNMTPEQFQHKYKKRAVSRPKLVGLKRNAKAVKPPDGV